MFAKKKKKPVISAPTNFQHRVHTGKDSRVENAFLCKTPFRVLRRTLDRYL